MNTKPQVSKIEERANTLYTFLKNGNTYEKDIVYTPTYVSKHIINYINPKGKILDPCKGDGAFYNYLSEGSEYCEIREGKDFFYTKAKLIGLLETHHIAYLRTS